MDLFELLSGVLSELTRYLWWSFDQSFSGTCSKRVKLSLFSLVGLRFKTVKDIERSSVVPGEMEPKLSSRIISPF